MPATTPKKPPVKTRTAKSVKSRGVKTVATKKRSNTTSRKTPKKARKVANSPRKTAPSTSTPSATAKYLSAVGVGVLFCCGIAVGALLLNRAFVEHNKQPAQAQVNTPTPQQNAQQNAQQRHNIDNTNSKPNAAHMHQTTQANPASTDQQDRDQLVAQLQQQLEKQRAVVKALELKAQQRQQNAQHTIEPVITRSQYPIITPSKVQFSAYTPPQHSNIVAIVIDDIGYQRAEGERTLALPGKLTLAVLPFTPFAKTLALNAPSHNKEVMLHAPMEPKNLSYWGEGLKSVMSEAELRRDFIAMINDVPNLIGVNNHMGSGLTENNQIMEWLMAELPSRGLYFIDSRTSAQSAAFTAAKKFDVPTYKRDVFLDNSRNLKDIHQQFDKLIETTNKKGMALGIGHPYPETLEVLEQRMPELKALGIELVTVSELLNANSLRRHLAIKDNPNN